MNLQKTVFLSLCLSALLVRGASATAAVTWYRLEPGCTEGFKSLTPRMGCGSYGDFVFGTPGRPYEGSCPFQSATEVPPAYTHETTAGLGDLPCADGTCLGRSGGPWVAVVDWDAPHGWTVAATILAASDRQVDVELFDLGSHEGLPEWLIQADDAHVLARLCDVAELAEHGDAPLAVNLSFGRLPGTGCASASLECEIQGLLSHLQDEHGTIPVAAAGHDGRLLFPASSARVIAAGSLDVDWYRETAQPRPALGTPAGAEALLPGYGLYLDFPDAPAGLDESYWPAPPGSSYASAFTAGWIAGALAAADPFEPVHVPVTGRWVPVRSAQGFELAHEIAGRLPGSALPGPTELLGRALGWQPEVYGGSWDPRQELAARGPAIFLPLPTLPEVVASLHGSQPGTHPCVPCGGDLPFGTGAELRVDLGDSEPLPDGHAVVGVHIQAGGAIHSLDRSQDPELLERLTAGDVGTFRITGLAGLPQPGTPLALVFVIEMKDGNRYRSAIPIHLHDYDSEEPRSR